MDEGTPVTTRSRPTIGERAARRARIEQGGADRYSSLVRALHAGEEVPIEQRRRGQRLRWHPIAWTLLRLAVVLVFGYLALSFAFTTWRDSRVDTWTGPDTSVTSGQRLAGCPLVNNLHDDVFPTWIRFEGSIYRNTGYIRPVGFEPHEAYPETGYALGDLRIHRILNTPDGQAGRNILLKRESVPTGQLFLITPDCS